MMEIDKHFCQVESDTGSDLGVQCICLIESVEQSRKVLVFYRITCIFYYEFNISAYILIECSFIEDGATDTD